VPIEEEEYVLQFNAEEFCGFNVYKGKSYEICNITQFGNPSIQVP